MARVTKQYGDKQLEKYLKLLTHHLKALRESRELSIRDLEEASKVSFSTIHEIETLKVRDVRLSTLTALARSLDVSLIELIKPLTTSAVSAREIDEAIQILRDIRRNYK